MYDNVTKKRSFSNCNQITGIQVEGKYIQPTKKFLGNVHMALKCNLHAKTKVKLLELVISIMHIFEFQRTLYLQRSTCNGNFAI